MLEQPYILFDTHALYHLLVLPLATALCLSCKTNIMILCSTPATQTSPCSVALLHHDALQIKSAHRHSMSNNHVIPTLEFDNRSSSNCIMSYFRWIAAFISPFCSSFTRSHWPLFQAPSSHFACLMHHCFRQIFANAVSKTLLLYLFAVFLF